MRKDLKPAPIVGLARPAPVGALVRLGPEPLSVYWGNAGRGVHAAGLGVAAEGVEGIEWLEGAPSVLPPGPWFGGWSFDSERSWSGFDAERWVLPEVLAWWANGTAWWAAFARGGDRASLEARLNRVQELEPRTEAVPAKVVRGDREAWDRLVSDGLKGIAEQHFEKLVCARSFEVEAEAPFSERAVLKALEARHPQCWVFLVRGRDGRAFLGASPETLCEIQGDRLQADALAGTAPRGEGATLLKSDKDRREHEVVVRGIVEALGSSCSAVEHAPEPTLRSLANVEHLWTPIRATLKSGVDPLQVAKMLHPTPAVAGTPQRASITWLRTHEGFARGWYAGAVGVRGSNALTLAVGLRSALLDGSKATVFVGAGVVKGSTPESEWLETERKARAVLPALGVHDV